MKFPITLTLGLAIDDTGLQGDMRYRATAYDATSRERREALAISPQRAASNAVRWLVEDALRGEG